MKYEVKFLRYTAKGSEEAKIGVSKEFLTKYPNLIKTDLSKRVRVWVKKDEYFHFGSHLVGALLRDDEFKSSIVAEKWLAKSLNYYTSNLYAFFTATENGIEDVGEETPAEEEPKVKKERKQKKVKTETVLTFQDIRDTLKAKIRMTNVLNHFTDPYPVHDYYNDVAEKERVTGVTKNIFNSYKLCFEELLTSRNIPFYISEEKFELPSRRESAMFVEYNIVDNTENVPIATLEKQSWKKLTLVWLASRRQTNKSEYRHYREFETILSTAKIGIALSSAGHIYKKDVKSLKTMREDKFTEYVNTATTTNNARYSSLINDFKSLKERIANNVIEEEKLKKFIVKDLIAVVPAKFLKNSALDFKKGEFEIEWKEPRAYSGLDILSIGVHYDSLENISIRLNFFGNKRVDRNNSAEAILTIKSVLENELRNLINVYDKAASI